jgi:predicted RecA/RadA family phage recombinase
MVFQPQLASGDEMMFTATGAVTAGVPVVLASGLVLLPVINGVSGDKINAKITGVHQLTKKASTAFVEGQACYWDATNAEVSDLATAGAFIGNCANTGGRAAALTTVWVRMAPDAAVAEGQAKSGTAFLLWDFGADGGTIGSYYGDALPDNAVVYDSAYEVLTTCTSATGPDNGTGALGVEGDDVGGIVAAVAINVGTPWDAGYHDGIQDGTASTFTTKTTVAGRRLQFDIGTDAFTAGKVLAWAHWVVTG